MTKHERLVEEAKNAIEKVFSDTSVSQSQTRSSLRELASDIQIHLSGLQEETAEDDL